MNNFQKTVDLKDKLRPKPAVQPEPARQEPRPKQKAEAREQETRKKPASRASAIDQVYAEPDDRAKRAQFQQIERAKPATAGASVYKALAVLFAAMAAGLFFYFTYLSPGKGQDAPDRPPAEARWYAVKLVNGETYYGLIADTSADPVIISTVYYNYDQLNSATPPPAAPESGNLRLVKRGKETHGPEGEMSVVRSQVLFMESLKEDSPVLKAILDNEK